MIVIRNTLGLGVFIVWIYKLLAAARSFFYWHDLKTQCLNFLIGPERPQERGKL